MSNVNATANTETETVTVEVAQSAASTMLKNKWVRRGLYIATAAAICFGGYATYKALTKVKEVVNQDEPAQEAPAEAPAETEAAE